MNENNFVVSDTTRLARYEGELPGALENNVNRVVEKEQLHRQKLFYPNPTQQTSPLHIPQGAMSTLKKTLSNNETEDIIIYYSNS